MWMSSCSSTIVEKTIFVPMYSLSCSLKDSVEAGGVAQTVEFSKLITLSSNPGPAKKNKEEEKRS
jgi:hypothetical protein